MSEQPETFDPAKILNEFKERVVKEKYNRTWREIYLLEGFPILISLLEQAALLAIASVREEFGKLLNQQGIVMQRKIKELEEQVEAQRKLIDSNDRMYQSSFEAHIRRADRIRSLESEVERLKTRIQKAYDWLKRPDVPIQSVITILRKALTEPKQ